MPSSIQEAIQPAAAVLVPTTSYGVVAAGWVTKWMDVRYLEEINLGLEITQGSTVLLTLRMESSSAVRVAAAPDDADIVNKVDIDGVAADDEIAKTIGADTNISLRISTKGMEYLRISMKANAASASVEGSVSYDMPHSRANADSIFVA